MNKLLVFITTLVFSSSLLAHGMSESDKQRILDAGFIEYVELGMTHMLSGYDHLLFLFGVIFFLTRFKDIVKFITAFTVGHSITLIFATLYGIKANYYLIDAVIALTVCYKAFENLDGFKRFLKYNPPNLLWMVLVFGLIHGFGLSTRLQELPLGDSGIVLNIIAFNIGVEVGQILALAAMLFLLSGWRKSESFVHFTRASNVALIVCGGLLFLMQLHGYQHSAYTDDFPLNKDDHHHVHKDMALANQPSSLDGYKKRVLLLPDSTTKPDSDLQEQVTPPSHQHGDGQQHSH